MKKKILSAVLVTALLALQVPAVFADTGTVFAPQTHAADTSSEIEACDTDDATVSRVPAARTTIVEEAPASSETADSIAEGISYKIAGTNIILQYAVNPESNTIKIVGCNDNARGKLVIPSSIDGRTVTWIEEEAFYYCTELTEVQIPATIEGVSQRAFYNCQNLKTVTFHGKETYIGAYAFANCTQLASVTLPGELFAITEYCFMACCQLKNINIPDSVMYIEKYAFLDCRNLTEITLSSGLRDLLEGAFAYCTRLKSIRIPGQIKSIRTKAFMECTSLSSVTLPDSIYSIGDFAFYHCRELSFIRLPDDLETIGKYAFENCPKMKSIEIPESLTTIDEEALGYIYNEETGENETMPGFRIDCFEDSEGEWYADINEFDYRIITYRKFRDDTGTGTWSWASDAIYNCYENKIMNGIGSHTFDPDGRLTRAQMVVMLYNLSGKPEVSGTSPFKDLKDSWYRNAVTWAYQNKVTSGTSATTFAPNDMVTREQLCTFLYNFLSKSGTVESDLSVLNKFQDRSKISSWAVSAMAFCVSSGIVNGTTATTLEPKSHATRAQAAVLFSRTFLTVAEPAAAPDVPESGMKKR